MIARRCPRDFVDSCITEVWELLERIGHETTDRPGITRAAWSRNEEMAADLVRAFARRHGLQVLNDAFGNIQFLLPGVDPSTPCVTTGSHLDSVPHGGNYDGLARNRSPSVVVSFFFGRIVFSGCGNRITALFPRESEKLNRKVREPHTPKPCNPKPTDLPKTDSSSTV